jgi:hypothetical protein
MGLEALQKELGAELADLQSLASATGSVSQKRRRDELLANLSTTDPALLNVKLRQVLKGVVFTQAGGIKDWQFIGSPAGSVDEIAALAKTMEEAARERRSR